MKKNRFLIMRINFSNGSKVFTKGLKKSKKGKQKLSTIHKGLWAFISPHKTSPYQQLISNFVLPHWKLTKFKNFRISKTSTAPKSLVDLHTHKTKDKRLVTESPLSGKKDHLKSPASTLFTSKKTSLNHMAIKSKILNKIKTK